MARRKALKGASVYQLEVTLGKTKPPIWRRVLVHSDTMVRDATFEQIQRARDTARDRDHAWAQTLVTLPAIFQQSLAEEPPGDLPLDKVDALFPEVASRERVNLNYFTVWCLKLNGQAETRQICLECAAHSKHVNRWSHVSARQQLRRRGVQLRDIPPTVFN